ncbi:MULTISPECIES: hypothetical protein [unclassified Streptomyces]|uniref:hypothetical protein n=1 Tax=unclassified Streptomyces TaxID=2593676 RepID=UPI000702381E|nr:MULTISPECIES: hypothetical protein [unclassified Streptomyces]KQX57855.1 hypothetical protein ASD33_25440 [Streptomyces sp. Root1304]KRA78739.1 hypothetical protein ASE09_22995 [Streptomyces sp. Root66D1]
MSQQQQRNWFARHKVLTAAGAVVAVIAIGAAMGGGGDGGSPKAGDKKEQPAKQGGDKKAPESKAPAGKKVVTIDGDGDFEVGTDAKPGLYRSTGNKDAGCYWERAKNASGDTDSILANDNVTGTGYVEIKATDKLFKSSGCGKWEAVDAKATGTPKATLKGDGGMFKVGVDIAPGTYKSTGNKDAECYWERSKDASHSTDAILANDNVTGTAIVKVTASDGYFKSSGCGDWTKTA